MRQSEIKCESKLEVLFCLHVKLYLCHKVHLNGFGSEFSSRALFLEKNQSNPTVFKLQKITTVHAINGQTFRYTSNEDYNSRSKKTNSFWTRWLRKGGIFKRNVTKADMWPRPESCNILNYIQVQNVLNLINTLMFFSPLLGSCAFLHLLVDVNKLISNFRSNVPD
jgi:hypothetical protein